MVPIANFMKKRGITGIDVHKLDKPEIPELGGLSIVFGLIGCSVVSMFLNLNSSFFLAYLLTILITAVIGVFDRLKPLNAVQKILLVAVASIPILFLNVYQPFPELPFVGKLRLTLLYPVVFVPVFVTVLANATNMIDVLNGSMAGTSTVSAVFLTFIAFLLGKHEAMLMFASLAATTYAFYRYNKYPAKVFSSDVGSLSVGAAFAAAAIMGRLEVVTMFALLPTLINGSLILTSLGGVRERREIKIRPTILLENGLIAANLDKKAPITLTRLMVASSPLKEPEITRCFIILHFFSGFLALATFFFMVV